MKATLRIAEFITAAKPPVEARQRAAIALCDTVGVILAGAPEPTANIIRRTVVAESQGNCRVLGTAERAGPGDAALANGVAAHAHDYDDMCFVSMAHPSCALVPSILAAGELTGASGSAVLDAYIAGFEVECRLGLVMNPRHYHERGWHCTSSIGTLGAAAAAARLLKLDAPSTLHALGIAASLACGLKENMGSMVKPLHAGMAARNGVTAARLAKGGFTASEQSIDGPQGYLAAMDSQKPPSALAECVADLASRWEILDTGVTVKLYPSCAATHPPLDALLALKRRHNITAEDIAAIDVEVDSMTPRLLIHSRPSTALEAKFSMPFCAASAIVFGHPTLETFDVEKIRDPLVQKLLPLVTMRANPDFDGAAHLSQANVTIRLKDGRTIAQRADGARGYPGRLSDDELNTKFLACAQRSLTHAAAIQVRDVLRTIETAPNIAVLTELCSIGNRPVETAQR
ncbi:MAG TPA: MmgE/PrpD family protein [Terriglobia bacterium]|nr:MmgE/PrpD family protein [Terriglobia bacterium]